MNTVFYSFFVSGLAGLSTLLGCFCFFFQKLIEPSKREGYSYECLDLPDNNPTYLIYEISSAQQIVNVYSVYKESLSLSILPMKVSEKSVDNN